MKLSVFLADAAGSCNIPTIDNGSAEPAGTISSGETTKVTCNSGYTGGGDMTCTNGNFDTTAKCECKSF